MTVPDRGRPFGVLEHRESEGGHAPPQPAQMRLFVCVYLAVHVAGARDTAQPLAEACAIGTGRRHRPVEPKSMNSSVRQ